jgi:hypothetical protein
LKDFFKLHLWRFKSQKSCEFSTPSAFDPQSQIKERVIFFDEHAVLVWNSGGLSVVEYESSKLLTTLATRYANSRLISLRLHSSLENGNSKILSHLFDSKTIRIINLETSMPIETMSHYEKID